MLGLKLTILFAAVHIMSLPQAPPTILGMCGVCGNDATIICTECSNMEYCNSTCQAANLTFHKTICPQLQGFPSSHAPSNLHFRSILFPINSKVPRFLWLPHFLDEYYKLDLRMIENHLTGKSENFEIECPHCEDIIDVLVWKDCTIRDLGPSPALLDVVTVQREGRTCAELTTWGGLSYIYR
jgi:hypothetical protein